MPDVPINVQLSDAYTDRAVDLMRFDAGMRQKVLGHLRELETHLTQKMHRYDLEGVKREAFKRRRAERLIGEVRGTIDTAYRATGKTIKSELRDLAVIQGQAAVAVPNQVFRADIITPTFTAADLRKVADNTPILGGTLDEWWKGQSGKLQRGFAAQVRQGVLAAETNQQLIQRIRGTATGRFLRVEIGGKKRSVREFVGGVMQTHTNEARTLVRTSVQNVSNQIYEDTYKENEDILRGMIAIVTLDGRTSTICIARSGGAWDLDGNPLEESETQEPYPGPPPWHPNCRTVLGPLTKSWDQIIEETTGKKKAVLDTVPDATRASMDGQVPGKTTFDDFLKRKGDAWARKKLGPGRYKLWKEGKITLPQLIDQSGRPLTIQQLKQLTPGAKPPKIPPQPKTKLPPKPPPPPPRRYPKLNPKGKDTWEQFRDPTTGVWTAERTELHNEILDDILKPGKAQKKPIYHMMGGGPASGKSMVIESGAVKLPKNAVMVDSDAIKRSLPEYAKLLEDKTVNAAEIVHNESSHVSMRAMLQSRNRRYNTVLDGTGDGSIEKLRGRVNLMKSKGYRVQATYVDIDIDEAFRRNQLRAERTGRLVPPEYVKGVYTKLSKTLPQAIEENLFDELELWSNRGVKPELVLSVKDGKKVVHNKDLWNRFVNRGTPTSRGKKIREWLATKQQIVDDAESAVAALVKEETEAKRELFRSFLRDKGVLSMKESAKKGPQELAGLFFDHSGRRSLDFELRRMYKEMIRSFGDKINKGRLRFRRIRAEIQVDLEKRLKVENPLKLDLKTTGRTNKMVRQKAAQAQEWLNTVISQDKIPHVPGEKYMGMQVGKRDSLALKVKTVKRRAFYDRGSINISAHDDVGTVIHEAGHGIEDIYGNGTLRKTQTFLRSRIRKAIDRGDRVALIRLRDAVPGSGYRADEKVWAIIQEKKVGGRTKQTAKPLIKVAPDDDLNRNLYVTKWYERGGVPTPLSMEDIEDWLEIAPKEIPKFRPLGVYASEVLSMGLEHLYRSPVSFAKQDPEFFDFIVDLIG